MTTPDLRDYRNALAYRLAVIMERLSPDGEAGTTHVIAPLSVEDLHHLKAAGPTLEHYTRVLLDKVERMPMPTIVIAPGQWQPIDLAPKDGTLVDLWGRDCTEDQSRALMMVHPAPRRFADCLWCAPMTMSRGGFISPIEKAWYQQVAVDLSPGTVTKPPKRIWPTHFMPVPGKP